MTQHQTAGSTPRRRSKKGDESRRKILDATFQIANELGYQGTTIALVSERSGLPASSVYWHFTDKDQLFAAVIDHSFHSWRAAQPKWAAPSPTSDLAAELHERISDATASIAGNPEFWRMGLLLALERQVIEPEARRRFVDIRSGVRADLARFWAHALADRAEDTSLLTARLAHFTLIVTDGIFVAAQSDDDLDLDAMTQMLVKALLANAL
ncbi:MAG: AcrR family transcriptional regulator [Candidatus Poriferisodalaceae bacterium]